jgi:hypothetical protein
MSTYNPLIIFSLIVYIICRFLLRCCEAYFVEEPKKDDNINEKIDENINENKEKPNVRLRRRAGSMIKT